MKQLKPTRKSRLIRQRGTKSTGEIAQIARLVALETRQAEMEARITHLEREAHRNFPNPWVTPTGPYPSAPPVLPQPMEDMGDARCHVCNGLFKDMTSYVCSHHRCPTRVTFGTSDDGINVTTSASTPDHLVGVIAHHGGTTFHQPSHFAEATIHVATGPHGAPRTIPTSKTNPTT